MANKTTVLATLGGRKFILAMLVVIAAFIQHAVKSIDSATMVHLIVAALGFYSTANVMQKFTTDKEAKDG